MFDPSDDLSSVADGVETVTLLRRGRTPGDAGTAIAHALRRAITAGEAAMIASGDVRKQVPSGGQQLADDLVWHLPVAELPDAPRLGDVILDGDGRRWTILAVKLATLGVRWRCETRDVGIAVGSGRRDLRAEERPAMPPDADLADVEDGHSGTNSAAPNDDRLHRRNALDHDALPDLRRREHRLGPYLPHPRCGRNHLHDPSSTGAERIGELQVIEVESSG